MLTVMSVVFMMLKLLAKAFIRVIQYLIFHLEEGEEGGKVSLIFNSVEVLFSQIITSTLTKELKKIIRD